MLAWFTFFKIYFITRVSDFVYYSQLLWGFTWILELLKGQFCFHSNLFRSNFLIMNFRNIWRISFIFTETCLLDKSLTSFSALSVFQCLKNVLLFLKKTSPKERCCLISKSDYLSGKPKHNHNIDSNEVVWN